MDKLQRMFLKQEKLQERLYPDFMLEWTANERTAYIKEMNIHLITELHEALQELPYFKPWKDYSNMNWQDEEKAFQKFREELVDMWHFFMNIMLAAELYPNLLYEMYLDKNEENHTRQDNGYAFRKEDSDG